MQENFFDRLLDLGTECFNPLFQSESYQSAFNKYQDWLSFCVREKIPEVMKVAEMFNRHITGVCNALVENLSFIQHIQ
jgi:transposase